MQLCFIEGTITKADPELKSSAKGVSYCNFTVSSASGYGKYKRTDYIPCRAFGKTAENICKYFKHKSLIQLEGEWHNDPWQKNEKGYDIPNWQFAVSTLHFPPKAPATANSEDDDFTGFETVKDNSESSASEFQPATSASDAEDDLPF